MAITQAVANSFKEEILEGTHDLETGGNQIKLALYTSQATLSAATTSYTTGNEVAASGQEEEKARTLHQKQETRKKGGAQVYVDDVYYTRVNMSLRCAILYNPTDPPQAETHLHL